MLLRLTECPTDYITNLDVNCVAVAVVAPTSLVVAAIAVAAAA